MKSKSVEIMFTYSGFVTKSDLGTGEMNWHGISQVWRYPDVGLLFFDRHGFITFPIQQLDDEVRGLIVERVESQGGKVI